MLFGKQYEIISDSPATISWADYERESMQEYQRLLETKGDDEKEFHRFFERNPAFMPGAFELIGTSGHAAYIQALITEPEIDTGLFRRYPDFIWLAQNSLTFAPILIEIERPNKRTFTNKGIQTADFTQALNQILEWKTILREPENILMFYKCFKIPDRIRKKTFAPQFGLVYGRRHEYEHDIQLERKRAEIVPDNVLLMSYDRLRPSYDCRHLLCCSLKQGEYSTITIPPTYQYNPYTADNLSLVNGFYDAISNMEKTSEERKEFLHSRYHYWLEYGRQPRRGIINYSDSE